MSSKTEQTTEFLRWLFGSSDDSYIFIWGQRGAKESGDYEQRNLFFKTPEEVVSGAWKDQVEPRFNLYYCTNRVKEKHGGVKDDGTKYGAKKATNALDFPAIYFDIDACKEFFDPRTQSPLVTGDEYLQDLRVQQPDVSAWVRSSENGIQGCYKLSEPIYIDGDKAAFDEKLKPALLDVMWYYGGDEKVCHVNALMRLPGSHNRKAQYESPWPVTFEYHEDRVHSLASIKERFKPDFDACPRVVAYAIIKLAQEFWQSGERNTQALALAGSIRQAGIDRASCKRLFKELTKALGDDTDRFTEVDATYDHDIESLATFASLNKDAAPALDSVLTFWFTLKGKYAKARDIEWYPEEIDPTKGATKSKVNGTFYERHGATYYRDTKGDEILAANFTMRIVQRVIKFDDHSVTALAVLTKQGGAPTTIEIPAALHNTWAKFSTIRSLPSGIGFTIPNLWTQYIIEIDGDASDVPIIKETPYYGILGETPMVFLPGNENAPYVWQASMHELDTAEPGLLDKEISPKTAKAYLTGLVEHIPNYHDTSYIITVLGWFCSCAIRELLMREPLIGHHPSLLITGQQGSGKSQAVAQFIAAHYGCRAPRSGVKGATTPFALKRGVGANNVCPYILDDFREDNLLLTNALLGVTRALWDGYAAESGVASGGVRRDHYVSPFCLIGESPFTDAASLSRTVCVRVLASWVRELRSKNKELNIAAQEWLHDTRHAGNLGTLVLRYVAAHLDEMPEMINHARKAVEKTCKAVNERKIKGFIGTYAGLLLLRRVYKECGVPFFLSRTEMLDCIYAADPEVIKEQDLDTSVMKQLFLTTDRLIIDANRKRISHEDSLYRIPMTGDVIYFQLTRWFDLVSNNLKDTDSVSLRSLRSFTELLRQNMETDYPSVLAIEAQGFQEGGVKVDLKAVARQFGIDVDTWRKPTDEVT